MTGERAQSVVGGWRGVIGAALASAILVLAPLPLGSDGSIWWAIWLPPLLAIIAAIGFSARHGLRDLWPVIVALSGFILVLCLQAGMASGWVSPSAWPGAVGSNIAGQMPGFHGFGTTRFENALWCIAAVAAAGLAGYAVGTDRTAAMVIMRAYALAGMGYACVAIALFLANPEWVFWHAKTAHREVLTTPFLNRNVACAFYGYAAISAMLLALRAALPAVHAAGHPGAGSRAAPRASSGPRLSAVAFWLAGAMLCAAAALLTGSRAGMATTLAGAAAAALIYRPRQVPRLLMSTGMLLTLLGAGLILFLAFGGALGNRFASRGVGDIDRWTTYASALAMVKDHPWLGVGALNFADAFPPYRLAEASPVGTWERAHSLPVQVAVEFGLPAAGVLAAMWLLVGSRLWRPGRHQRDNPVIACAGGIWLAAGLHSLVDYPMQIAGLALPVLLITGCALSRAAISDRALPPSNGRP